METIFTAQKYAHPRGNIAVGARKPRNVTYSTDGVISESKVGEGRFGVVFLARKQSMKKTVGMVKRPCSERGAKNGEIISITPCRWVPYLFMLLRYGFQFFQERYEKRRKHTHQRTVYVLITSPKSARIKSKMKKVGRQRSGHLDGLDGQLRVFLFQDSKQ